MGKVSAHPERISLLKDDLEALPQKGIVYLGPRTDVYQPLERKHRLARQALELFLATQTPVFVVTRSELVLKDLDVLRALAAKGLIEISITIASRHVINKMEPHTLPVAQRLDIIRELTLSGVPVSVHMSPIIPALDTPEELASLMDDVVDAGAICVYACMLGVTDNLLSITTQAVADYSTAAKAEFQRAYPMAPVHGVGSAPNELVFNYMSALSLHATQKGLPFACVHIPVFDTVERTGGIFRFKVPNVGDFVRHFDRTGAMEITLEQVLELAAGFSAVDDDYLSMLTRYFQDGTLFQNTYFHCTDKSGPTNYRREPDLDLAIRNMRVGKRSEAMKM
jgi:hypothetical protein